MTARRIVEPQRLVMLQVDGKKIPAAEGESVATALYASGRSVFGRSVKYHRPRGPSCFAGKCDGCLMRVDGVGNVMTCRVPAREGMVVETQNVVGSAENDLLAATDWFFPTGMNHHEMFTGWKPLNQVMQKIARRIAGIGELPAESTAAVPARTEECDVLIVGAGAAGLAAAAACAARSLSAIVVDDGEIAGGHRTYDANADLRADAQERFVRAQAKQTKFLFRHTAVGVYDGRVLVDGADGALTIRPKRLLLATGMHEGAMAIAGGDAPRVMGVRAMSRLLHAGVAPGKSVVAIESDSARRDSAGLDALAGALSQANVNVVRVRERDVVAINANARSSSVETSRDGRTEKLTCDAVVVSPALSAVYELASQAGATVQWRDDQFIVSADEANGQTSSPFVRVVGSATGNSSWAHNQPDLAIDAFQKELAS